MENTRPMPSKPRGSPGNRHGEIEPVERVAASVHEAVDKVADATHRAADAISEKGAQLQGMQEEWMEDVRGISMNTR